MILLPSTCTFYCLQEANFFWKHSVRQVSVWWVAECDIVSYTVFCHAKLEVWSCSWTAKSHAAVYDSHWQPCPKGCRMGGGPSSALSEWGSVCYAEWPLTPCVTVQTDVTLKPLWQRLGHKAHSPIRNRGKWWMGLSSKGLWLLRMCIEVRTLCPATNNTKRLENEGAVSLVYSTFHLKQKLLSKCKLSTLDASLLQTYSQKTNHLSFVEIG